MQRFLQHLRDLHTPLKIILTFPYKLALTLDICFTTSYQHTAKTSPGILPTLLDAIQHQNIIGWDLFLRGYKSIQWIKAYEDLFDDEQFFPKTEWDVQLVKLAIDLYR